MGTYWINGKWSQSDYKIRPLFLQLEVVLEQSISFDSWQLGSHLKRVFSFEALQLCLYDMIALNSTKLCKLKLQLKPTLANHIQQMTT